jgi:tRNA threonylcarbamoyl adenosine modification protein YjeE
VLSRIATEFAGEIQPGDRVLLEGPLGAGKSTFARALLHAVGVHQPPEGSPTFAIAHEYDSKKGGVVHVDLYRLKSEAEIEESGILAYLWERKLIAILEWASLWPEFETSLFEGSRVQDERIWQVSLVFGTKDDERNLVIMKS